MPIRSVPNALPSVWTIPERPWYETESQGEFEMGLNLSMKSGDDLRIGSDLDTRGKPTDKASRINSHSQQYALWQSGVEGPGFGTLLAAKAAGRPVNVAGAGRMHPANADLLPETVELIGKRRAVEDRARDPRFPQPFETDKSVGAANSSRDRDGKQRRQPPSEQQEPESKKPKAFRVVPTATGTAASVLGPQEDAVQPLSEWEEALLLDDVPPTVPLIGRTRKAGEPLEPVLITGRGRQRGPMPNVRRAQLPAPRIPASKLVGTAKTLGVRAFAKKVAAGGKKDPRMESVRPRFVTGGHPGRI